MLKNDRKIHVSRSFGEEISSCLLPVPEEKIEMSNRLGSESDALMKLPFGDFVPFYSRQLI